MDRAGSLVTWFKRGAPHYFDMLTGKRNVRCELCGFDASTIDNTARYPESTGETRGTLAANGTAVDANTGPVGVWCSGHGECRGATPEICYEDEPSRPCPVVAPASCACDEGFLGVGCEFSCPLGPDCGAAADDCALLLPEGAWVSCGVGCVPRPRVAVCSGRGRCEQEGSEAICLCDSGFWGPACEEEGGCPPSDGMCMFRNTSLGNGTDCSVRCGR